MADSYIPHQSSNAKYAPNATAPSIRCNVPMSTEDDNDLLERLFDSPAMTTAELDSPVNGDMKRMNGASWDAQRPQGHRGHCTPVESLRRGFSLSAPNLTSDSGLAGLAAQYHIMSLQGLPHVQAGTHASSGENGDGDGTDWLSSMGSFRTVSPYSSISAMTSQVRVMSTPSIPIDIPYAFSISPQSTVRSLNSSPTPGSLSSLHPEPYSLKASYYPHSVGSLDTLCEDSFLEEETALTECGGDEENPWPYASMGEQGNFSYCAPHGSGGATRRRRSSQPGRTFPCFYENCGRIYSTGAGLRYHLKSIHNSITPRAARIRAKPKNVFCELCPDKSFSTIAGLRYHEKTIHTQTIRQMQHQMQRLAL
ncbi:hypothetical protein HDU85_006320 [Gaertneriomyces sp. JEL0708]|nr:hypothetical protein HDU85_006320 [Gaertneriomyces sp. JEL0708]